MFILQKYKIVYEKLSWVKCKIAYDYKYKYQSFSFMRRLTFLLRDSCETENSISSNNSQKKDLLTFLRKVVMLSC